MKIGDSSDIYEDSGLSPLLQEMNISKYFINNDYGNNDVTLFFVIICLAEHIKERRPRLDNKDYVLYWDIIMDYETVKKASTKEKKRLLANQIIKSFDVLNKYKKLNLNKETIKKDIEIYFNEIDWL